MRWSPHDHHLHCRCFFAKEKKHSFFLNVFHCDIFLVWLSVKVIFDFNQRIRWLRQAGGNLTSIKLLVRSLWQKTKIVFQVFAVVLAADEALFKHGNIQVPKVTWKSIMKKYCDLEKYYNLEKYYETVLRLGKVLHRWNGRLTCLFQMTLERVLYYNSWKANVAHFFDLNCPT